MTAKEFLGFLDEPIQERFDNGAWVGLHQFGTAESVDLVSEQAQISVLGNHRRITLRADCVAVRIMVFAIDLDDDALAVGSRRRKSIR